jgi:hypothetical protein
MTSKEFMDLLFGPLPKDYCYLFVIFSAFALFSIAIALLSILGLALFAKPKVVMNTVPAMLPHIIVMGIVYLQNRLLYGMCTN